MDRRSLLDSSFQMLERNGLRSLVNASHVKTGAQTDVNDCQWLQELHTFGMLRGSFRQKPDLRGAQLPAPARYLSKDAQSGAAHAEGLTEMNIQIHRVISDITGVTGMSILRAILAGERDCIKLAQLRHPQIKSSAQRLPKLGRRLPPRTSLCPADSAGTLRQLSVQIMECDQQVKKALAGLNLK